jgi:hypothetical protein
MQAPEAKYEGSIAVAALGWARAVAAEMALFVSRFNLPPVDPLTKSVTRKTAGTMTTMSHLFRRPGGRVDRRGLFGVRSTDTL